AECARRFKTPVLGVTPAAERILTNRPWHGNVRELRNTIERACLLADGSLLTKRDLTRDVAPGGPADGRGAGDGLEPDIADGAGSAERARIVEVLRSVAGNKQ